MVTLEYLAAPSSVAAAAKPTPTSAPTSVAHKFGGSALADAGPDVTAAGVFADLLRVAATLRVRA